MCLINEKVNSFTLNSFIRTSTHHPSGQASSSPVKCNLSKKLLCHMASLSFTFLCFVGLIIQLIVISEPYFTYDTGEQITIEMPSNYTAQAVSLCVHYKDVISDPNLTLIRQSDIFNHSLDPAFALKRAEFRLPFSYKLNECVTVQSCRKYFNSSKYTYGPFVCYKFFIQPDQLNTSMSFQSLSVTPAASGMIYRLWMSHPLNLTSQFKITTHSPHLYPLKSFNSVKLITRNVNKITDETPIANNFYSSQTRLTIQRLKAPYKTNCFNYTKIGLNSRTECLQRCINQSVTQKFNKLPFSVLFNNSIDLPLITYDDLLEGKNVSMAILKKIADECSKSPNCKQEACESRTAFTFTVAETGSGYDFVVEFIIPRKPNILIRFCVIMYFAEYVTYVMGTISTWIGLTVVNLNPLLVFYKFQSTLTRFKEHFPPPSNSPDLKQQFTFGRSSSADNLSSSSSLLDDNDFNLNLHLLSRENINRMSKEEEQAIQTINMLNARIKRLESKIWMKQRTNITRIVLTRTD